MSSGLLERDTEFRALESAFAKASAGSGCLVAIEGPAGQGKSALVAAARERAAAAGLRVLSARGGELERDFPFGVIRQLFEPLLAAAPRAEHDRLLRDAGQPAQRALRLGPEDEQAHGQAGLAVVHAVSVLALEVAARGPLLLTIDDAHWADRSSLRAIGHLAANIRAAPIAIVAAMRPVEPGAPAELLGELRAAPGAMRLVLAPLGAQAVARIVRERIPGASEPVCQACHEVSGGNPLYLEELLRTAVADGLPPGDEAGRVLRTASVLSLGDRVMRRVARVAPAAAPLAVAMAILGDGAPLPTAAALAGLAVGEARNVAAGLRRIEVLSSEDPFSFVHPLVRRSVYAGLDAVRRDAAHATAADLLADAGAPVESVASHLAVMPSNGSAAAAAVLIAAGENALAHAAPDEAARWFQRALDEAAAEPPAAEILSLLGTTEVALREPAATSHLQAALAHAMDPALRSRTAVTLAEAVCMSGRWSDAFTVVAAARHEIGDEDPEALAALAAIGHMLAAYAPRSIEELALDPQRVEAPSRGPGWGAHALAATLAALAAHRGEGVERVGELVDRALEGGHLLAERGVGTWAAAHVLIALVEIDQYDRALAVSHDVSEAAQRAGSVHLQLTAADHRGWIHARRGDLAAAEAQMRPGLELALAARAHAAVGTQLFYLSDPLLERPTLEDVARLALTLDAPELAGSWTEAMLMTAPGRLRVAHHDLPGAIEDLRTSLDRAAAMKMGPAVAPSRSLLALALPTSEREEAQALIAEELELARATGLARPQGVALRAAGMVAGGDDGIERLRESVALLEASGARLEHARSLVELGAALRRRQRRVESREPLARGLEVALACGAVRLAARAQGELRATGTGTRRVDPAHRDVLTPSELRVAHRAAEGASNGEIARELLVSVKTVETHLSSAYAKLGLSGHGARRRLNDALPAQADTFEA